MVTMKGAFYGKFSYRKDIDPFSFSLLVRPSLAGSVGKPVLQGQ